MVPNLDTALLPVPFPRNASFQQTGLFEVSVDIVEVEAVGMADMLDSLVLLHPLAPPTLHISLPALREGRTTISAGSAGHEHAHVLLVQRGGGHLAVDGAEVSGLLLEEIVASSDGLRATSPTSPHAWGSSRRAGRRGSCWSA